MTSGVVSLYSVLGFYARDFVSLVSHLEELKMRLANLSRSVAGNAVNVGLQDLGDLLQTVKSHCVPLSLRATLQQIARIEKGLRRHDLGLMEVCAMIQSLQERIDDELSLRVFFSIEAKELQFFRETDRPGRNELKLPRELFGDQAIANFPGVLRDVEEASKALVFGLGTACVFHLMRVMEHGLRALAVSLNDPRINPDSNPNWESILRKCDDETQKPYDKKSSEWKTESQFFSEATANLRAVKDAWRNPTMHVEIFYDPEMAYDVWHSSRAFMRHLATKLHG
jgi:hypothetical protein